MNIINVLFQLTLLGNYEDISPNFENIKFFVEKFESKNLIPNQFTNVHLNFATGIQEQSSRLQLTSSNKMWEVKFNKEILEIKCVNADFGKTPMISISKFNDEVTQILNIIEEKFSRKHKLIGLLVQQFFNKPNEKNTIKNLFKLIPIPEETQRISLINKKVAKIKLDSIDDEGTIDNEIRYGDFKFLESDRISQFNGLFSISNLKTDNNGDFRFDLDHIKKFVSNSIEIQEKISKEYLDKIGE